MVTGQEEEATWEPQAVQVGAESSVDSAQGHVACTHMQLSTREPAFPRLRGKKAHGSLDPKLLKTGMQILIHAGSQQRKGETDPNPSKALNEQTNVAITQRNGVQP